MRLLRYTDRFELTEFDNDPPPYAILSHTWSLNAEEEVTYEDITNGTKKSLDKLERCRKWAAEAGYTYFWVDTCCIDTSNDTEVVTAKVSNWSWYKNAGICFVYLSDLSIERRGLYGWPLQDCRWFTRSWTLQELLAPARVEFHARNGRVGSKLELFLDIKKVTGINVYASLPNHHTRLLWLQDRKTTLPQDYEYCLLGLCNVVYTVPEWDGEKSARGRLEVAIRAKYGLNAMDHDFVPSHLPEREQKLAKLQSRQRPDAENVISQPFDRTCDWILTDPVYAAWLNGEEKFLFITGHPGTGKSVMLKHLAEVMASSQPEAAHIRFHFGLDFEEENNSSSALYTSLIVQLLDDRPHLLPLLDGLRLEALNDLQVALRAILYAIHGEIWLFVDAVDAWMYDDKDYLTKFLDDAPRNLHVCFTSRHYPAYRVPTKLTVNLETAPGQQQAIADYVAQLPGKSTRRQTAREHIVKRANGIFLWAVLAMGIVRPLTQCLVRDIRILCAIKLLRDDLGYVLWSAAGPRLELETLDEEFRLCLRWILYAQWPLSLSQWYGAMMAGRPEHTKVECTEPDQRAFLVETSRGLAQVADNGKVQIIHESIQAYLLRDGDWLLCRDDKRYALAHEQLRDCCVAALQFRVAEIPGATEEARMRARSTAAKEEYYAELVREHYPFARYATMCLLYHADLAATSISQTAFLSCLDFSCWSEKYNILKDPRLERIAIEPQTGAAAQAYVCVLLDLPNLLKYIQPYDHTCVISRIHGSPLEAACVRRSWKILETILATANAQNATEIITELQLKKPQSRWCKDLGLKSTCCWAVHHGLMELTEFLLPQITTKVMRAESMLFHAASSGDVSITKRILAQDPPALHMVEHRQLPKTLKWRRVNALGWAASCGHIEVVKFLLSKGAVIGYEHKCDDALSAAILAGHDALVPILLDAKPSERILHTAFNVAFTFGHRTAALSLLRAGASASPETLLEASSNGDEAIVSFLLGAGADVNLRDKDGTTALLRAAKAGHAGTVQHLIRQGAKLGIKCNGKHALGLAAVSGHVSVIRILLEAGLPVDTRSRHSQTALMVASMFGEAATVELLLDKGASMYATDGLLYSAWHWAKREGQSQIVKILETRLFHNNGYIEPPEPIQVMHPITASWLLFKPPSKPVPRGWRPRQSGRLSSKWLDMYYSDSEPDNSDYECDYLDPNDLPEWVPSLPLAGE